MSRITFTKEIVQDAQRLVEQLNLMMTQVDSVSKPVNALRAQVTNINNTITGMGVVKIQNNAGSLIGARDTLQFLNGSLISWNIIDDPVNARVQIAPIVSGAHDLTAGTSLQITAGTGVGAVLQNLTLNTIQGIRTSDSPTFAGIFLTGMEIIFGGNTIRMFDATNTFYSSFSLATLTANRGLTIPNVTGVIATVDGGQTFTVANWQATPIGIAYGGTGQATTVLGFNALSPLTTKGDVLGHDGTNNVRLGVGTNGYVLSANSAEVTGLKWIAMSAGSPLTTKGDIFVYSTVDDRLPVGTDTYILSADSTTATGLKWIAPSGASSHDVLSATHTDTLTASVVRGDLIVGNLTPKWSRLAIGTVGQIVQSDGTDVTWHTIVDADIPDILTITKISNLTSNGFVKTSAGDGTLSVDTSTYLTGNQTITLTGDVTGSGATSIATTYTGVVPVNKGGTNLTSYTIGDLLYASAATTLAGLVDVTVGQVLMSGGVATAPAYTANPLISGYTRIGSTSVPANTTAGDLTVNRFNIGNTAFTTDNVWTVIASTTQTAAGAISPLYAEVTFNPASASSSEIRALNFEIRSAGANTLTTGMEGGYFIHRMGSSGSIGTVIGVFGCGFFGSTSTNFGTVTKVVGGRFQSVNHFTNNPTGTIATAVGLEIPVAVRGGTNLAITTAIGLNVGNESLGSSTNIAILVGAVGTAGNWSIYNNNGNANYFYGMLKLSAAGAPTASIHIGTNGTIGHIRMDGIAGNPASPTDGDHWYNSTQESHRFRATVGTQGLVGLVYAAPDTSNTVSNTTTETDFDNNYTLPASSLTVGKSIRVRASGVWGQINGTVQFKVYIGANAVYDSGAMTLTPSGSEAWWVEADTTIRTTGSSGVGRGCGFAIMGINRMQVAANTDSDVIINTTTTAIVKVAVKFNTANAGNTAKMTNLTIEVLD